MADLTGLKKDRTPAGLPRPPKPTETFGNVLKSKVPQLLDHALEANTARTEQATAQPEAETPEPADATEQTNPKRKGGRPPLSYKTRQLGARVRTDTFDRVTAISQRERVGLGPLVDRMVAAWERQRLAEAEAIGPRHEGENDDAYIARIFRL